MKKQSGCMTAFWIIAAIVGVVALIHLGVAYYLFTNKFNGHQVDEPPATSAPMESASASPA